jgi:AAA+ ATPase superfamily predicted ATPase
MFVNRVKEIAWLEQLSLALASGKGMSCALLGLRRIGKTELMLNFRKNHTNENVLMPYLNIQSSMSSPMRFCLDFVHSLLESVCMHQNIKIVYKQSIKMDLPVIAGRLNDDIYDQVILLMTTLDTGEYDEALRITFKLPEMIANRFNIKVLYFIDEFQELHDLKHYKIDPYALMRTVTEKQIHTKYVVSGSIISLMEEIFKDANQPFFNQFNMLYLSPLTKEDSIILATHIWNYDSLSVNDNAFAMVYKLTHGHPFYIVAICERAFLETRFNDAIIDQKLVEYAFIKEVMSHDGKLNTLFEYIFNYSISKVERKGALKQPLLILADEDGLTLSDIAKKVNKSTGHLSNLMKSLLKSDLIIKNDKRYYFRDQVLRFWLAKTSLGKSHDMISDTEIAENFISDLKERYLKKSSEYGRAKEFELYYFINENQGQSICGVKIPKFKRIIKNYMTPQGEEIDLFAINDKSWAFELKWKNKKTGTKEIKKFLNKIQVQHLMQSLKNRPMPGIFMICMAMCGNGVRIGMVLIRIYL